LPIAKRHYRLALADILQAHDEALKFGGLPGIPNLGMVEAAIARPYNGYYRKIEEKCAAIIQSIAGNHGFADGNKRTALICLAVFIARSDYELFPVNEDEDLDLAVEQMILDVVNHDMTFDQTQSWFKARIRRP
jgi:death-on-curing protein